MKDASTSPIETRLRAAIRADLSRARRRRSAAQMKPFVAYRDGNRRTRAVSRLSRRIRTLECELTHFEG